MDCVCVVLFWQIKIHEMPTQLGTHYNMERAAGNEWGTKELLEVSRCSDINPNSITPSLLSNISKELIISVGSQISFRGTFMLTVIILPER